MSRVRSCLVARYIAAGLSFVRVIRTHLSEMKPTAIFWCVQRSIFIVQYLCLFTLVVSCVGLRLDKSSYLSLDDLDVM